MLDSLFDMLVQPHMMHWMAYCAAKKGEEVFNPYVRGTKYYEEFEEARDTWDEICNSF